MSEYSFLPFLRQGIARRITAADLDPGVRLRAGIPVALELGADGGAPVAVTRTVELFGPGDVVGIESRAIVRVEPRPGTTNFEPGYLPCVEFYDEDFPWRYTPATPAAGGHRLRPWIALAALREEEFEEAGGVGERPLACVRVADAATAFPPAAELAAWAHVHVNGSLLDDPHTVVSADGPAAAARLQALLDANPDQAYSRILCPRRLEPNAAYHLFLLPVFESGRLAGLGKDPALAPYATFSAWEPYPTGGDRPEPDLYPVYQRWYFRTGGAGDFETLVRRLTWQKVDGRVGRRDLDVRAPGTNLPGIVDPALGGVLKLGGALRAPMSLLAEEERARIEAEERWAEPFPHPFQEKLAALVNLADGYTASPAPAANQQTGLGSAVETDPDPLVTPPIYGRWHALTRRLLLDRDGQPVANARNWVHELNLDPRHRVAAGLGTRVVQQHQERYMNAAWEQIGGVLAANELIRRAQLAREVTASWHRRDLAALAAADAGRALMLTAPVHARVRLQATAIAQGMTHDTTGLVASHADAPEPGAVGAATIGDGGGGAKAVTLAERVRGSRVPAAALSAPMRSMLRPGGRLARSIPTSAGTALGGVVERIDAGTLTAAPPREPPTGAVTLDDLAKTLAPAGAPAWVLALLRRFSWLPTAVRVGGLVAAGLLLVAVGGVAGVGLSAAAAGGAAVAAARLSRWASAAAQARTVRDAEQTPAAIDRLAPTAGFVLSAPGSTAARPGGGADSPQAARLKTALREAYALREAVASAAAEAPRPSLELSAVAAAATRALEPARTIPARTLATLRLPARYQHFVRDRFEEVMAYPVIDEPMYRPLVELSTELFLPNLHLVPENSVTLLESNQKFIEAYMVGVNHEFAREQLWREYPTDQRSSCFRQFWDPRARLDAGAGDAAARRERLRDLPPIDRWPAASALGTHDARQAAAAPREEVVLVVRGELLQRYPTAVLYAQRAAWPRLANGAIDHYKPRSPAPFTAADAAQKVRTPLYQARVEPDIYFFGFDLTVNEARGGDGTAGNDDPGWFLVLEERAGEPRFGLDEAASGPTQVWNDLAWNAAQPGIVPGDHLRVGASTPALGLSDPGTAVPEKHLQFTEDVNVSWGPGASPADVAYVLFQPPVRVAVHAAQLLGGPLPAPAAPAPAAAAPSGNEAR